MPFIVVRFKERNLHLRFWNCVRPYDGSFSKIGKLKYDRLAILRKLTYFKTHRLKMLGL